MTTQSSAAPDRPDSREATRQLALIALVQVLAMATWFAASAAAPTLRDQWALSPFEATLLTSAVQLGFVVGALVSAATTLADVVHPPLLLAVGSVGAAVTTAAVALVAGSFAVAVILRLLTGVALSLVYPVGMKLAVSWFRDRRGLAVGVVVAALTVGSTFPHLLDGLLGSAWRAVLLVAAASALAAAVLQRWVRVGPLVARSPRLSPAVLVLLVRQRAPRLATLGYLGHMWELYAVWAWLPAFFVAGSAARGDQVSPAAVGVVSFVALGVFGAIGCLVVAWFGDRVGRARAATVAMCTSGVCCCLAAVTFGASAWVVVPVLMVWGASVIADSAMFSACLGSVVEPSHVGTALTLQTALGFLLTIVTIQLVPVVADHAGWPAAVAMLAVGPLLGAVAMVRLDPMLTDRGGAAASPAPARTPRHLEEQP